MDMRNARVGSFVLTVFLNSLLFLPVSAWATLFTFVPIFETTSTNEVFGASINNNGTVAFRLGPTGNQQILTGSGGPLTIIREEALARRGQDLTGRGQSPGRSEKRLSARQRPLIANPKATWRPPR